MTDEAKEPPTAEVIRLREPGDDSDEIEQWYAEVTRGEEPSEPPAPIPWITASMMAEPLPPVDWVVAGLGLAPGRPNLLFGKSGSVKTILAQHVAIAVATGSLLLGQYSTGRGGPVAHLDYDQGRNATIRRYQRIAAAQEIDLAQMDDQLRMLSPPPFDLTSSGAEAWFSRALDGVRMCVLDSMIAACPGQDENDAKIGEYMRLLWRVSESTGCAVLLLHHSGKDSPHGKRDSRDQARGSSSIMGYTGCGIYISGPTDEPRRVECAKASVEGSGHPFEAFYVRPHAVDLEGYHDPDGGLALEYLTDEQANPQESPVDRLAAKQEQVIEFLRANPGASKRRLRASLGGNAKAVDDAVELLVEDGMISTRPDGQSIAHYLTERANR
jgi:hypothetical protein